MSRTAGLGVALCVAAGVAACGGASATGPEESSLGVRAPAAAAAKPHAAKLNGPRAVTGHLEGSDQYGDLCGDDQGVLIVSTGTGTISHFGKAVMVSTMCVSGYDVIGPTPFSIKAANGDEAGGFLTDFAFTSYGFDLYTSITWGTGRFEGATGALVFPTASTGTGVWSSGVEGWITY